MVMVLGAGGQLGQCLLSEVNENDKYPKGDFVFLRHGDLDITDENALYETVGMEAPDALINCAAYTNVDGAETSDGLELASKLNRDAVGALSRTCARVGTKLIHISTDYVFGNRAADDYSPYGEYDKVCPLNNYGRTKAEGERLAMENGDPIIVRTSWLYSEFGKNFYRTVMNRVEKGEGMKIVDDQWGSPTYARDLARFILGISMDGSCRKMNGIYHYSNDGWCTWYDFGAMIRRIYEATHRDVDVPPFSPIFTDEYPQRAKRPPFSVMGKGRLSKIGIKFQHWVSSLCECMERDNKI